MVSAHPYTQPIFNRELRGLLYMSVKGGKTLKSGKTQAPAYKSKVSFIMVSSPIERASRNSTYETPQLTQSITSDSIP